MSKEIERHSPARKRNVWVSDSIWTDEEADEAIEHLRKRNPHLLFRFKEHKRPKRFSN